MSAIRARAPVIGQVDTVVVREVFAITDVELVEGRGQELLAGSV